MTLCFQILWQKLISSVAFSLHNAVLLVVNSSELPNFSYKTEKQISDTEIMEDNILLIIKNLNLNKAHGWNNVSIPMIQLRGKTIVTPLKYLFESSLVH